MPTFEFREWLVALIVICGLLFCLTPLAARGMRGLRPLAWFYAVLMFLNGLGHTLFTILGHTVASVWLMVRLRRTARVDFQLPTGY